MELEPFIIDIICSNPVENVWRAITNSKEMKEWYFHVPGFRAEPGYKFQFSSDPNEERQYTHFCKVTECIPMKKLSFTWQYNHYETLTLVTFELFEMIDGKTTLRLIHEGLDSYPESDPDFSKSSFIDGWKWIIEVALKSHLEKVSKTSKENIKMEV